MIYEPREDSLLLQKYVKKYAHGKVLDLGTGSGIQARTALNNTPSVIAADIDPQAVASVRKQSIRARTSDLFQNIMGVYDVIIFNPPYLPEDERENTSSQMHTTGGRKGHEIIERFLHDAKRHLKKNGKILLVTSSLTRAEKLFEKYRYHATLLEECSFFFEKIRVYLLQ